MASADKAIDWNTVQHAYGAAVDLPALFARVRSNPVDDEAWVDLWSRLCHQGTVYAASYAALPALLKLAEAAGAAERSSALILMGAIVASDDLHGVEQRPTELIEPIARAAAALIDECFTANAGKATEFLYLLAAATAFDGDMTWGRNLWILSDGDWDGRCPVCNQELNFISAGQRATAEARLPIQPAEPKQLTSRGAWLHDLATRHGQAEIALGIRHLFGRVTCPACRETLDAADALSLI